MMQSAKRSALLTGFGALMIAVLAHGSVNKSVKVEDGAQSSGESSVNGSITVGDNATVTGELSTVNGSIRVGRGSVIESADTVNGTVRIGASVKAENLETVNGAIKIGDLVEVRGNVTAVNGSISLDEGSSVGNDISNVNGDISLSASRVGRDVTTVNGDVELSDGAVIARDLIVEEPRGISWGGKNRKPPKVIIGPGCRVEGLIRLERKVRLYISDTAEVGGVEGELSMADAVRFSGKRP